MKTKLSEKEKWLLRILLNDVCYNWEMMNSLQTKEAKNFYYSNIKVIFSFVNGLGVHKKLIDKCMNFIENDYLKHNE